MKTDTATCKPTPRVAVEREVTLLPPTGLTLPRLDDLVPHGAMTVVPRRRLDTTYYDTTDLRLIRNGITLRHRSDDSGPAWTVKLPDGPKGPALTRREIRFTGPPGRVPDEAVDLVLAVTRAEPLAPVARIRTRREATRFHDGNGRLLLEVDDDAVTVSTPKHHHVAFREVDLEAGPAIPTADTLLHTAMRRLIGAGCVTEPRTPMLVRALGAPASAPPDVVVAPLRKPVTVPQLVRHSITRSVVQILRHDPGVRLGEDPEYVHQLRVGTRRLRSDLRTFAHLLDTEPVTGIRAELGWLAALVGAVRDTDVLAARLRASSMALSGAPTPACGPRRRRGAIADHGHAPAETATRSRCQLCLSMSRMRARTENGRSTARASSGGGTTVTGQVARRRHERTTQLVHRKPVRPPRTRRSSGCTANRSRARSARSPAETTVTGTSAGTPPSAASNAARTVSAASAARFARSARCSVVCHEGCRYHARTANSRTSRRPASATANRSAARPAIDVETPTTTRGRSPSIR
jgi:inorganic triphosphatase YgiF